MARAKNNGNGRVEADVDALKQSMTNLNQAMAAFLANQIAHSARMDTASVRVDEANARHAEFERTFAARMAEIDKRFTRIEDILIQHSEILRALPDAVRDKF